MFVCLHRAIEVEEVLVLVKGIGEDLISGCIALTTDLFRFRSRLRDQHRDFAIRTRANFLRALRALRAELRSLALTFGLHALIDRLAGLLGKTRASTPDRDDLDAVGGRLTINQYPDTRHQVGALVAHDVRERHLAKHPTQRRIEKDGELRVGTRD